MSNTTTEYNNINEAWEAGNEWVKTTDRYVMLDFLTKTASPEFKDTLLAEIVHFMNDKDFAKFFNHLRSEYGVMTPQEFDYQNH